MAKIIAIRDAYGDALAKLGAENEDVVVLESDVGGSTKSCVFGKQFPDRYFNVGIAELGMTTMSAGFARCGKIPFVNTFSVFLATRGSDAIQSLAAYDKMNMKLAGTYCGLSDSYDGASHQAITDMAFVRSIPNMTVISPCDAVETEKAVFAAAKYDGPVYIRLSRAAAPVIYDEDMNFEIGKGILLRDGTDLTIVATGTMVSSALEAADQLAEKGINAAVIDIHTVLPLDETLILEYAKKTGCVVSCEEHSIRGGLTSAVAECLSENRPTLLGCVGVTEFAESGDYNQLLAKYGLDAAGIVRKCVQTLEKK
ncbi:MAG: transketolase C-terminal domain-containing protein [Lawsonibacter sp.]|nr:transketolase C-terminal domain-containing protein [Lawsonibacter sp.]